MLAGAETPLLSQAQPSLSLSGVLLPAGDATANNTVGLVAYVRDSLGCEARCTSAADASTVTVTSLLPSANGSAVEVVQALEGGTVESYSQQGNAAGVVASVSLFSQLLSTLSDPCASVHCGAFGSCLGGVCECVPGSGYTGALCDIPPTPTDGVWSAWTARGPCSVSCGGGTQTWERVCSKPTYGGAPCVGATTQSTLCHPQPCPPTPVDGGWSAWSPWSVCSAACPGNVGGFFPGSQSRSRGCNAPSPSLSGQPCAGNDTETRTRVPVFFIPLYIRRLVLRGMRPFCRSSWRQCIAPWFK